MGSGHPNEVATPEMWLSGRILPRIFQGGTGTQWQSSGLACSSPVFDEQHRMKERRGWGAANQLLSGPQHPAVAQQGGAQRRGSCWPGAVGQELAPAPSRPSPCTASTVCLQPAREPPSSKRFILCPGVPGYPYKRLRQPRKINFSRADLSAQRD